jgi:hypothetical protein
MLLRAEPAPYLNLSAALLVQRDTRGSIRRGGHGSAISGCRRWPIGGLTYLSREAGSTKRTTHLSRPCASNRRWQTRGLI